MTWTVASSTEIFSTFSSEIGGGRNVAAIDLRAPLSGIRLISAKLAGWLNFESF